MKKKVRTRAMNWFVWLKKFKPVLNHIDKNAAGDSCMFETYGKEVAFVKKQDHHKIWTLISISNYRNSYITPGWHHANRIGYFITEIPWTDEQDKMGLWVLW